MKKSLFAMVYILLSLTLCSCSIFEGGPQSSPEKVMMAYLEAFKKYDFDAMACLTAEHGEDEVEQAQLINFIKMISLENYSIEGVEYYSESEAAVKVNLTMRLMGSEKTLGDSVKVVCKDGKWFLTGGVINGE